MFFWCIQPAGDPQTQIQCLHTLIKMTHFVDTLFDAELSLFLQLGFADIWGMRSCCSMDRACQTYMFVHMHSTSPPLPPARGSECKCWDVYLGLCIQVRQGCRNSGSQIHILYFIRLGQVGNPLYDNTWFFWDLWEGLQIPSRKRENVYSRSILWVMMSTPKQIPGQGPQRGLSQWAFEGVVDDTQLVIQISVCTTQYFCNLFRSLRSCINKLSIAFWSPRSYINKL